VSLHGNPIHEKAHLPGGGEVTIRVGRSVVVTLDTILDAEQVDEAHHLANRVRDGLSSGELEPTAHSLGPLTDELL